MSNHGDINNDGVIDRHDLETLNQLVRQFGGSPEALEKLPVELFKKLDLNRDGQLDEDDIEHLCKVLFKGSQAAMLSWKRQLDGLQAKVRN